MLFLKNSQNTKVSIIFSKNFLIFFVVDVTPHQPHYKLLLVLGLPYTKIILVVYLKSCQDIMLFGNRVIYKYRSSQNKKKGLVSRNQQTFNPVPLEFTQNIKVIAPVTIGSPEQENCVFQQRMDDFFACYDCGSSRCAKNRDLKGTNFYLLAFKQLPFCHCTDTYILCASACIVSL